MTNIKIGTHKELNELAAVLCARDAAMARAFQATGPLQIRKRPATLASLISTVVAQQISTASANAIWGRFKARVGRVDAPSVLALGDTDYDFIGLTRQKRLYVHGLAEAVDQGRLKLGALHRMSDADVSSELMALKGIGRWTAEVYLLFCLGRPNILPGGDLALQQAAAWLYDLPDRPDAEGLMALGEAWRPLRGVAAYILWAYYKVERDKRSKRKSG